MHDFMAITTLDCLFLLSFLEIKVRVSSRSYQGHWDNGRAFLVKADFYERNPQDILSMYLSLNQIILLFPDTTIRLCSSPLTFCSLSCCSFLFGPVFVQGFYDTIFCSLLRREWKSLLIGLILFICSDIFTFLTCEFQKVCFLLSTFLSATLRIILQEKFLKLVGLEVLVFLLQGFRLLSYLFLELRFDGAASRENNAIIV